MHAPQPPYPSFSLVMSALCDPNRLPPYRDNHRLRFHPYQRPPQRVERLMRTVDYRYEEFPDDLRQFFVTPDADESESTDLANLETALVGQDPAHIPDESQIEQVKRRRRLSTLIIDLALAFSRRCKGVRIVRQQMPPEKVDLLE